MRWNASSALSSIRFPKKLHDQFATGDALIESLQKEIADRPHKHGKPGDVRMELDEPSGRLIVRATPNVQRFLSGQPSEPVDSTVGSAEPRRTPHVVRVSPSTPKLSSFGETTTRRARPSLRNPTLAPPASIRYVVRRGKGEHSF